MNIAASPDTFETSDTSGAFGPGRAPDIRPNQLTRPVRNRMLVGVAAGIADYLDLDPTIVRIILAVLAVVGGVGVPLYLAGWLLIPEEGAEKSIAADVIAAHRARSR